jgi:hypothetical protein
MQSKQVFHGDIYAIPIWDFLVELWVIIYWSSFLLSFTIFPFFTSYTDSNSFTKCQKASFALKYNLAFYGICLLIFVVFFGILIWDNKLEVYILI